MHAAFVTWARTLLPDEKTRTVFDRMAERSGIDHRYSVLQPGIPGADRIDAEGFFHRGRFPSTAARMGRYAQDATGLALDCRGGAGGGPAAASPISWWHPAPGSRRRGWTR